MRTFAPLLLILALAAPAGADGCIPTTSHPEIDTGETPAGRYYVDNDDCQNLEVNPDGNPFLWHDTDHDVVELDCLFSIWWYQESNGIDGLQRWDEVHDDTCGGQIPGDTLAFY